MTEPRQDTPELPSLPTLLGWIGKRTVDVLLVVVLATILGEVYLRTYLGCQHEYGPDADLGHRFKPNQDSYRGRINSDGDRGPETDWERPLMVALGDSQAFGSGLPDGEIWTTHLADHLNQSISDEPVQVVNAAHPGFGPHQQLVELRRVLDRQPRSLRAVLVRVSIEDRNFLPPKAEDLPSIQASTERRSRWRAWSRFAPFVVSRVSQQVPSLASLLNWTSPNSSRPIESAIGETMWTQHGTAWREMIDLASRAQVPLVFFVHDPTDLPSNGVLRDRLKEASREKNAVRVFHFDSHAWGLLPGTPEQMWEQHHGRYTLQHDHHGNELHHARVAEVLCRFLKDRPAPQFAQRGASNQP